MASHGIRGGSTLTSTLRNVENETGPVRGKAGASTMEMAKGRVTRTTRAALGDKTNQAILPVATKNAKAGFKKEAAVIKPLVKPSRLTKQKATTSLTNALNSEVVTKPTGRVTRLSAEKISRMEQDEPENQDVEMDEVETLIKNRELIDDIDKDDVENPQLVVEYVNEIYAYLRQLEVKQEIRPNYLKSKKVEKTTILPKMRAVLVDWLIQVHQQFNLLQETLYLTVAILDRFLQDHASKIERKQLQLVGVASMFIAAKYEEMYAPEIGDFVYITDRAYTESQIREMEMKILSSLEFNLGRPLPLNFLRRNSKAGNVDALVHTLAKYVMELTLVNYEFTHWEPSKLAAAALALSLKVLDRDEKSIQELWTPTLVYYTAYPIEKLRKMVTELASWVWDTTKQPADAKLMAVRKKYEDKKLSKIAGLSDLTGPIMAELKNGAF
jgi:hypothetical protein